MIGKIFGNRYELLEKVGTGGMAVVYKAKCHLLNRFVAVKVLREEYVTDKDFLEKFSKEAQSAASLSHHNIVNIYDVGNENNVPYIVMEYVPGVTLKEYIENYEGFLKNEEIANFSRQIALALEHAHSNQIIHRDIKPHNILVAKDGTLKVADFGIASAISETTTSYSSEAIGSVKYSSPEQARGRNVDERTDLYSLGVLMYEMATRSVPFQGDTAVEIALKHMKDDIVPPSTISRSFHKGLESIVMRSLLKDIGQRYQSARELVEDLEKIINNPTVNVAFYDFESDSPTQKLPSLEAFDNLDEGEKRTMKSRTTQKKVLKKPNKNILAIAGVILLAFVAALVIFFTSRLAITSKDIAPDYVLLPSVVNMSFEEAKSYLVDEGFEVVEGASEKNNEVEAGRVSSQRPTADTKLRPGYPITLHVSEGALKALIPNLAFKTLSEAQVLIENTKFSIGDIEYVNDDLDKGYILSQTPEADIEAKDNAVISLKVSLGPEYTKVIMPRLTSLPLEEAQKQLIELGLEVGDITYEEHVTIEKDAVITQSISEGNEVDLETLVDIVISLGNEEEEALEETDPNAVTVKVYNIPTTSYVDQSIVIKVTYTKEGVTTTPYNKTHVITADDTAVSIEISASGKGMLNFFINDVILSSREVDFSK